jgi:peptide/nickel transport system ATP-binding protein
VKFGNEAAVILEGVGLTKLFGGSGWLRNDAVIRAVDNVSIKVFKGETLAIVGESGCGKSTLARLLLKLIEPSEGEVRYEGLALQKMSKAQLRALRRHMQMVFQDPFASLNPAITAGAIIAEPIALHRIATSRIAQRARVRELLHQVGLPQSAEALFPHQFSGGQRQRISIARALACSPKLILGDEPLSALDVSVQAQIINLLADLKERYALTLVMVAHDLGMVRHMSDRVAVMYLGQIVESGPCQDVFETPLHPYTQALLSSIPAPNPKMRKPLTRLQGEPPSPAAPPKGCRFHTRCPHAKQVCKELAPPLELAAQGQEVACHFWKEIAVGRASPFRDVEPSENLRRRLALFRERGVEQKRLASSLHSTGATS